MPKKTYYGIYCIISFSKIINFVVKKLNQDKIILLLKYLSYWIITRQFVFDLLCNK